MQLSKVNGIIFGLDEIAKYVFQHDRILSQEHQLWPGGGIAPEDGVLLTGLVRGFPVFCIGYYRICFALTYWWHRQLRHSCANLHDCIRVDRMIRKSPPLKISFPHLYLPSFRCLKHVF